MKHINKNEPNEPELYLKTARRHLNCFCGNGIFSLCFSCLVCFADMLYYVGLNLQSNFFSPDIDCDSLTRGTSLYQLASNQLSLVLKLKMCILYCMKLVGIMFYVR